MRGAGLLLALLATLPAVGVAGVDPVQLAAGGAVSPPHYWQPPEGEELIGAQEWRRLAAEALVEIVLRPGKPLLVHLDRRSSLRVELAGEGGALEQLTVARSLDGQLFHQLDRRELRRVDEATLVVTPSADRPWLARLALDGEREQRLRLAVSRLEQAITIEELAEPLLVTAGRPPLNGAIGDHLPQQGYLLSPGDGLQFALPPAGRIEVESRRIYQPEDGGEPGDYRLWFQAAGRLLAESAHEGGSDWRNALELGEESRVVGEPRRDYLEMRPDGDGWRLCLAYSELMAERRRCLPPGLQSQRLLTIDSTAPLWLVVRHYPPVASELSGGALDGELATALTAADRARKMARDNRLSGGALAASALLEQAWQPLAWRGIAAPAGEMEPANGWFERALLPLEGGGPLTLATAHFGARLLQRPGVAAERIASAGQLERLAAAQQPLQWVRLPATEGEALQLPLPGREQWPLRIHLAADAGEQQAKLQLRHGQSAVERWWLAPLDPGVAPLLEPSPQLLALAARGIATGLDQQRLTLSDPLAAASPATFMGDSGVIEWQPDPAESSPLRLWGSGWLALAVRGSAPYRLDESDYLSTLDRLPSPPIQLFRKLVRVARESLDRAMEWPELTASESAIANEWWPLLRRLAARERRFFATVGDGEMPLSLPLGNDEAAAVRLAASRAASPVIAVEQWMRLVSGSRGAARDQAQLALADALGAAGEHYLQQRLLRRLARDGMVDAWSRLQQLFEVAGEEESFALEGLLAARLLSEPDGESLAAVASRLLEEGEWRETLQLLDIADPEWQRSDWMTMRVEAALAAGWLRSFEQARQRLFEDERLLWQGERQLLEGRYDEALTSLRRAGTVALPRLTAVEAGVALRQRLLDGEWPVEERLVSEWAAWYHNLPGRRYWRSADATVSSAAAVEELLVTELDLRQRLYRAEPGHPLELELVGPVSLRIEGRRLFGDSSGSEGIEWLLLRGEQGEIDRRPLLDEQESTGLELRQRIGEQPGRLFSEQFELPAGIQRLTIEPQLGALLLRPSLAQPLTSAPLPRPTTALTRVGAGSPPSVDSVAGWRQAAAWPSSDRLEEGSSPNQPELAGRRQVVTASARPTASVGEEEMERFVVRFAGLVGELVAAGDDRQERQRLLVAAERLYASRPELAQRVAPWYRRLTADAGWELIGDLEGGEGVRMVEADGWLAESPALRIRSAMLPPAERGDRLLSGGSELSIALYTPEPRSLQLDFTHHHLPFLPALPITVSYRIGEEDWQQLRLEPANAIPQRIGLPLAAGSHTLSLAIDQSAANHFVRFRVSGWTGEREEAPRRRWQLVTRHTPLTAWLEGPAWLRLDRLTEEGEVVSQSLDFAEEGWGELQLTASKGEALYRLFRRTLADGEREDAPPPEGVIQPGLPPAVASWPDSGEGVGERFSLPAAPPGHYRPATRRYRSALIRPLAIDDQRVSDQRGDYLELLVERRRHSYHGPTWKRLAGWLHLERGEAPALGLEGSYRRPFDREWSEDGPDLEWSGELVAQSINGAGEWGVSSALSIGEGWALDRQLNLYGRVTLLARHLSLETMPTSDRPDPALYSDYKRDHRFGLELEARLSGQPRSQWQWWSGAGVVTNEPGDAIDHLRLDGGVRGWLAGWIVEGEISHRHYLRDHHRRDSLDRSRIGVEASWQGWRDRANIVRWLARWSYLPQSDDHGLLFGVEWSDTGGRGLRDFSPATPPFRQLLQRSMPPEMGETQSDGRSNDHQGGGL